VERNLAAEQLDTSRTALKCDVEDAAVGLVLEQIDGAWERSYDADIRKREAMDVKLACRTLTLAWVAM
jgi:hypothetical protein